MTSYESSGGATNSKSSISLIESVSLAASSLFIFFVAPGRRHDSILYKSSSVSLELIIRKCGIMLPRQTCATLCAYFVKKWGTKWRRFKPGTVSRIELFGSISFLFRSFWLLLRSIECNYNIAPYWKWSKNFCADYVVIRKACKKSMRHHGNWISCSACPASEHFAKYLNILKARNDTSDDNTRDVSKQQHENGTAKASQVNRGKKLITNNKSSPIKQLQNKLFNNNNQNNNSSNNANHVVKDDACATDTLNNSSSNNTIKDNHAAPPVTARLIPKTNHRIPSGIFRATTVSIDYDDVQLDDVDNTPHQCNKSPTIEWDELALDKRQAYSANECKSIQQLFADPRFLHKHFFKYFEPIDCCQLAQVCKLWRDELYSHPHYWRDLVMVIDCHRLRREYSLQATSEQCSKQTINGFRANVVADSTTNSTCRTSSINNVDDTKQSIKSDAHRQSSDWPSPPGSVTPSPQLDELDEAFHSQDIMRAHNSKPNTISEELDINNNDMHDSEVNRQQHQQIDNPVVERNSVSKSNEPMTTTNRASTSSASLISGMSHTGSSTGSVASSLDKRRVQLYESFDKRNFDSICLLGASDEDIIDFITNIPASRLRGITYGSITNSSVTNKGVEVFMSALPNLNSIELSGCNDITNSLNFSSLRHMNKLCVTDCINIADGFITRIHQVLSQLDELTLQSYHITDASMDYLQSQLTHSRLRVLELPNCKEITNESVVMLSRVFPDLEVLSLSGSSKISDEGIEVLAEHAHCLRRLDISWCSKITDAALECIACDLSDSLNELIVDRCIHVTDVGLGYLSTMPNLHVLSLRWCQQITDLGLETLISMRTMTSLSIAGCHQITMRSLLCLVRSPKLAELELTNCPSVSFELLNYLQRNLPRCVITF
ncbi:F-box/LRR-repeat protein 16 [Fragariocoptes setiger]|uniref:F-box/LRR-repeat protein 16 n=1 Tax=Fragariocoptes setiger TaxID=1670756 RepID=A0ABQ7S6J4_9ACAR|nr:F-box/LRR-repeat protein 16 [Fragariocoptes setiger]